MLNAFDHSISGERDDLTVASLDKQFSNFARWAHVKPPSVHSQNVRGGFVDARKVVAISRISIRGERNE